MEVDRHKMGSSASQPVRNGRKANNLRSQITQTELSDVTKKLWIEEPIIPPSQIYGSPIIPSDIEAELNELEGFPKENKATEKAPEEENQNSLQQEEALDDGKEPERNKFDSRGLDHEGKNIENEHTFAAGSPGRLESTKVTVQSPAPIMENEEEMQQFENAEEEQVEPKPGTATNYDIGQQSTKNSLPKSPLPEIPPRSAESAPKSSRTLVRHSSLPPLSPPIPSEQSPPKADRAPRRKKKQSPSRILQDQLEYVRQSTPKSTTPVQPSSLPTPTRPKLAESLPKSDPPPSPRKKHFRRKSRSKKRHHHRFDPAFPQPESGPRWSPKQPRRKRRSPRRRTHSEPQPKNDEKTIENPWVIAEAKARSNKAKSTSTASLGLNNEYLLHSAVNSFSMTAKNLNYSKAIRVKDGKVERKVIPEPTWNYWTSKPGELSPVNRRQTIIF